MSHTATVLDSRGYDRLRRAAESHREDLVVRLGGEVGLRPAEMSRVRLEDISTAENHHFLAVRNEDGVCREAYVPPGVEHDLRKYATASGRADDEVLLSVSPRRLQMLVREVAERAGETDPELAEVSSQDLRWRFAAALLADDVPAHVVCALGGWERLSRLEPLLPEPGREAVVAAVEDTPAASMPARLRQIIDVAGDIGEALADAATVEGIERTVCERLAETEGFRFAWIAERTGDGLTTRTSAGIDEAHIARQERDHTDTALAAIDGPVVSVVAATDGPLVLVPLVREDGVSGVLVLGTTTGVDDAERELLGALGAQIGAALSAVERKRLLLADTVTELTFECTDTEAVTVGLSAELNCRVELSGVVPVGGQSLLYYLVVDGTPTDPVLQTLSDHRDTADARLMEDYGNGALLEVVVTAAPALSLVESGGRVRELTAENGTATITAELPGNADLRAVVDSVLADYPSTALTAKHETERPIETDTGFRERLTDRLTERQATVLQAAFHSGYFEWPRGTTAEELADSLSVSAPTLHNHLRKAQQKLLTAFFADPPRGEMSANHFDS